MTGDEPVEVLAAGESWISPCLASRNCWDVDPSWDPRIRWRSCWRLSYRYFVRRSNDFLFVFDRLSDPLAVVVGCRAGAAAFPAGLTGTVVPVGLSGIGGARGVYGRGRCWLEGGGLKVAWRAPVGPRGGACQDAPTDALGVGAGGMLAMHACQPRTYASQRYGVCCNDSSGMVRTRSLVGIAVGNRAPSVCSSLCPSSWLSTNACIRSRNRRCVEVEDVPLVVLPPWLLDDDGVGWRC